jgi:hypothetical protein
LNKLQFIDVLTNEILIEEDHYDSQTLHELTHFIENYDDSETIACVITDRQNRSCVCEYVSYTLITNGDKKLYQLFFNTSIKDECMFKS